MPVIFLKSILGVLACAPAAVFAQTPLEWRTVGAPGNRPTIPSEVPRDPTLQVGKVDYEFRMTRTEVTVGQWFEFVQAYGPFYTSSPLDPAFTSTWISPAGPGKYQMGAGTENLPADPSWRMAARYTNWLTNGKRAEAWAFETGAYDTSTFTRNPDGTYNDQEFHSPEATFWISTQDEWIKGMHYDPNRYGPGQEGYWKNPAGGDEQLISGYPWEGGQTSAGIPFVGSVTFLPVASYPNVQSPWGLLDGSGGVREWVETDFHRQARGFDGSMWFEEFYWEFGLDRLDLFGAQFPTFSGMGFRVSSAIPEPASGFVLFVVGVLTRKRRREEQDFARLGEPGQQEFPCTRRWSFDFSCR